jgi:hypothetical protein
MGIEQEQSVGAIICGGALRLIHASYTSVRELLTLKRKYC